MGAIAVLVPPATANQSVQTPAPSVAFTDEQPISIKLSQLRRLGALRVQLTNLLRREQPVTLSVVGLRPADSFSRRLFKTGKRDLPPRATRVIRIPLASAEGDPAAATYKGFVVAVGASGPLARLSATVTDTGAEAPNQCAEADALRDSNQPDAATTAYKAVLKEDPNATCARDALSSASGNLRDLLDDLTAFGLIALQWLALIAGVLTVGVLLASLSSRVRKQLVRWPWLDRRLAPRLAVQDFGEEKKSFAALVREELVRETGGTPYRLDRVTARDSIGKTLGNVEAVDPSLKILGAVLDAVELLLPRARFTASGALQSKGVGGAGATALLEGGRETASATLWSGDDTGDGHQALAVPVAAWIDYEVHCALKGPPGIGDARSYALLQGGLDCERRGDVDNAERLYAKAHDADPANVAAIINLANLKARGREKYLDAVDQLQEAVELLHVLR